MSLVTRRAPAAATAVESPGGGGWRNILEPFTGAWQRNQSIATPMELETYSTVYACMLRISSDIGKLPFTLKRRDANGLWGADRHQTITPLLRRQNVYQTPAQFREAWILSKLSRGNTYVLKGRNSSGAVTHLWVLDPNRVESLIAPSGDVFYRLRYGRPENLLPAQYSGDELVVPATEIIHDREMALFHQLIGVGPLDAATLAANKNIRIQQDATKFFTNGANPGGILTAPAGMTETDAQAVKEYWNTNFQGANAGKVAVIGADMKFTSFAFKAIDSQMVEQLRYSDEQIAHAFGIPPFKVGIGSIPAGMKVDDLNQMYYADALQARIEAMEDCLDQALGLGDEIGVEAQSGAATAHGSRQAGGSACSAHRRWHRSPQRSTPSLRALSAHWRRQRVPAAAELQPRGPRAPRQLPGSVRHWRHR